MSEDIKPELIEKAARAAYYEDIVPEYREHMWSTADTETTEAYYREARAALEAVADDLRAEGAALSLPDVVRQAKAEAWDEGHYMSELTWRHVYDGHDCAEGEMCPTCCQPNPYRGEAKA